MTHEENAASAQLPYRQELSRSLGVAELLAYGLVEISPLAAGAVFGVIFNVSHGMVPLVYAVGLVAMLFTALSYATMVAVFPVAGSVYTYANQTLGHTVGFLTGWAILLDYVLVPVMAYVVSAIAIQAAAPGIPRPISVVILVTVVTLINYLGIKSTARASLVLLAIQFTIVLLFVVLAIHGVMHHVDGARFSLAPFFNPREFRPSIIFGGISLAMSSFLGFDGVSTLSEESRDGPAAVGTAILLSLLVTAFLFIVQAWLASLFLLGHTRLPAGDATDAAFYYIADSVGGYGFKLALILAGQILAVIAAVVTAQAAAARVIFGMARDRKLPHALAHVDPVRKVPVRSTLLVATITLVLALCLVDRLALVVSMVAFGALVSFVSLQASVITHFARCKARLKWWRHLAVPAIGILIIGYVLWTADRNAKIIGTSWLIVGLALHLSGRLLSRGTEAGLRPPP
jgi:amino acid transporter